MASIDKNKALASLGDIRDTQDLLARVIGAKVAGSPVVTVSLRARSIAALRMIADIDPGVAVVFCHASDVFPDSVAYRDDIVARFGLTDVTVLTGSANAASTGPWSRCEHLWAEDAAGGGRVHQIVHLDSIVSRHDVWLSAVYHFDSTRQGRPRIAREGGLLRVDPLSGWDDGRVMAFLKARDVPLHPRIAEVCGARYAAPLAEGAALSYAF